MTGSGRGGRNVEFLLAMDRAERDGIYTLLAGDTDGVDGMEDIAGAYLAPDSLSRARKLNIDPAAALHATTVMDFSGAG